MGGQQGRLRDISQRLQSLTSSRLNRFISFSLMVKRFTLVLWKGGPPSKGAKSETPITAPSQCSRWNVSTEQQLPQSRCSASKTYDGHDRAYRKGVAYDTNQTDITFRVVRLASSGRGCLGRPWPTAGLFYGCLGTFQWMTIVPTCSGSGWQCNYNERSE